MGGSRNLFPGSRHQRRWSAHHQAAWDSVSCWLRCRYLGARCQHEGVHLEGCSRSREVLGLAATDVINGVWLDGQAVLTSLFGWGLFHYPYNTFHNIVNVDEVPAAVAVVLYLDGLATQQFVGETKVGHIGPAGRTLDGEEAQARGGNVVEFAVSMRHQLVALLGGGIETAGAGVDEVLHVMMPAGL